CLSSVPISDSVTALIFFSWGGQLKRLEPDSCETLRNDGEVWNILVENGISTFLERMSGYSALVSYAVTASWSRGRVQIGSTKFTISTNAIADATGLPATGDIYYRRSLHAEIQEFNAPGDRPRKYMSGYTRDSLPSPWDRVAEAIMSPGLSGAADLLGLAQLYPDSSEEEQGDINQFVADPPSHSAGSKEPSNVKDSTADTPLSTPAMDFSTADIDADEKKDQNRADIISSILSKLQRAFKALKDWEDFTNSTRMALANDCSELLKLADLLANDSGSPRAKD
ncbi:hypothetical protein KI387_039156, partial [Taxus chinensis]